MDEALKNEKLLGIDYGETNIGLAFGTAGLTMSLTPISGRNDDTAISEITRLAMENKVAKVIIGLPVFPDGKLTPQALKVKTFVRRLKIRLKTPIVFVDESTSTMEALGKAIDFGISKKRRSKLDSLSAEVILRRYYDDRIKL